MDENLSTYVTEISIEESPAEPVEAASVVEDVSNDPAADEATKEFEDETIEEIEIEMEETIGWSGADGTSHKGLYDRNEPDQHIIGSITGLKEKLDQIEALKTVYSNKFNAANYYKWSGNEARDEYGYFVSLVPGSSEIAICNGPDIFGVTVDSAGFVGGQDATVPRDNRYALVATTGLVDVRCEYTGEFAVAEGDYVVSNGHGVAERTTSGCGYKVVAVNNKSGVFYASIALGVQADTTDVLDKNVQALTRNMEDVKKNVSALSITATDAYNKATDSDSIARDSDERSSEAVKRVDDMAIALGNMQKILDSASNTSVQAKEIANGAVSEVNRIAKEAYDASNKSLSTINELISDLTPITEWEDPASGNTGAEYLATYIKDGVATKAEVQTVDRIAEENKSWIAKSGESIEMAVSSVDKYSVGEYSQAYGLTLEQARSILKEGMVYIPTEHENSETHNEQYEFTRDDHSYTYEVPFSKGNFYIWESISIGVEVEDGTIDISGYMWSEGSGQVWFGVNQPIGSLYMYWYDGEKLHLLNDGEWIEVATLAGNVNNRLTSMVRQDVDEVRAEVVNARGGAASLGVRITDTEAKVNSVAAWPTDNGTHNMVVLEQRADQNGAYMVLAAVTDQDGKSNVTEIGGAKIVLSDTTDGNSHISIDADNIILGGKTKFTTTEEIDGENTTRIDGANIATGTITADQITTGTLGSNGYSYTNGNTYSTNGTLFNLDTGELRSENFAIGTDGNAYFNGTLDASQITTGTLDADRINTATLRVGGRNLAKHSAISGYATVSNDFRYALDITDQQYGGLKIAASIFEAGKNYVLSYKFTVDEGSDAVSKIAGHCAGFTTNKAIVDGATYTTAYSTGYEIDTAKTTHTVEIYLTFNGGSTDDNLYIQLQRVPTDGAYTTKATVWDVQVEEGVFKTGWTNAPEDAVGGWTISAGSISSAHTKLISSDDTTMQSLVDPETTSPVRIVSGSRVSSERHTYQHDGYILEERFTVSYNTGFSRISNVRVIRVESQDEQNELAVEEGGVSVSDGVITIRLVVGNVDSQYVGTAYNVIIEYTREEDVNSLTILDDGSLYAQAAQIYGTVSAENGNIGGWTIGEVNPNMLNRIGLFKKDVISESEGYCTGMVPYGGKGNVNIWAGASYQGQAMTPWEIYNRLDELGADTNTWSDYVPFYVTGAGQIKASSGKIGGFEIRHNGLVSDPVELTTSQALFKSAKFSLNNYVDMFNNDTTSYITTTGERHFEIKSAGGAGIRFEANKSDQVIEQTITITPVYVGLTPPLGSNYLQGTKCYVDFNFSISNGGTLLAPYTTTIYVNFRGCDGTSNYYDYTVTGRDVEITIPVGLSQGRCEVAAENRCTGRGSIYQESIELSKNGASYDSSCSISRIGMSTKNNILYSLGSFCPKDKYSTCVLGDDYHVWGGARISSVVQGISDVRLKNNIINIPDNYEQFFDDLRPVSYKYNYGTSDRMHLGLIAQEVEVSLNNAGIATKDFAGICIGTDADKTYALRYEEFIPLNILEIQKLKKRVTELESKLAELTPRND